MAAEVDIEVPRGAQYFGTWDLRDTDGVAVDLTGHSLSMAARQTAGAGSIVASATIEILGPDNRAFSVLWSGGHFLDVGVASEIVRLPYELKHVFPDGIVEVSVRGDIILMPEIN